MSETVDPLVCPFCGCHEVCYEPADDYCWAECNRCGAQGPTTAIEAGPAGAIAAWNRRHAPSDEAAALRAQLAQLEREGVLAAKAMQRELDRGIRFEAERDAALAQLAQARAALEEWLSMISQMTDAAKDAKPTDDSIVGRTLAALAGTAALASHDSEVAELRERNEVLERANAVAADPVRMAEVEHANAALRKRLEEAERQASYFKDCWGQQVKHTEVVRSGQQAIIAKLDATVATLRADNERLRAALVKAAVPLEALKMAVKWELSQEMKRGVSEAVAAIRTALAAAPSQPPQPVEPRQVKCPMCGTPCWRRSDVDAGKVAVPTEPPRAEQAAQGSEVKP